MPPRASPHPPLSYGARNRSRIDYRDGRILFFISGHRRNPAGPVLLRPLRARTRTSGEPMLLFPSPLPPFWPSRCCTGCPEVDSAMNGSFRDSARCRSILSDSERSSSTPRRPRCLVPAVLHL
jgi:hypothetical protein